MQLYSAAEMVAADRYAIDTLGLPGAVLMENAGRACAQSIEERYAECFPGPVVVVAGKGNNGGDGYVIARILADHGWQVTTLVLADPEKIAGDAAVMLQILRQCGGRVVFISDEEILVQRFDELQPHLIVDALFGTGLASEVRGLPAVAIALMNKATARVIAVDLPSGVDASNGRICGCVVRADVTVSFDHPKIGHISTPGALYVGELEVVDIGIPATKRPTDLLPHARMIDAAVARSLVPERPAFAHKGTFGHLLVVAGSPGKTGAAALAGDAALRSGCGLVTVAVPASVHDILEVKLTEAMTVPLADRDGLLTMAAADRIVELAASSQALALGPGLSQSDGLRQLLRRLVTTLNLPLVIDADGLNLLVGQLDCLLERQDGPLILTPHPGEMARLVGMSVAAIEADRFDLARDFARRHRVILLLKGARTIIAAPDGRVHINTSGNNGLSSGGSGDVLTGLIGGLLAQGCDPFAAASLAAWMHGRAAEQVAENRGTVGMTAGELILKLPLVRQELAQP
ncbi:NAD(P)H-hydrate dehydratase [Pelovirga terrestris]|uniref:Bifunctional NAD(P)H-hydrate repair enzyme n=1 Tax=Pelovirga terrestris TaxID=2771352 RepID=A0A8J6R4Z2_9BACT|nr:NAD(P)H-hydrate dehydratase [Pelovirga terrestris]MBD1399774.1 NAD(P)H-hydrate dehydratase [Pelovirga terrestris]